MFKNIVSGATELPRFVNPAEGDFHLKESNWEKHNAVAIYDDSKWTYMDRPPIPLPLVA